MDRKDRHTINRRDFVKSGTVAVVAANYLGLQTTLVHAGPATPPVIVDAADIMKAAAGGILEINQFFKSSAAEIERMKGIQATFIPETDCQKVLSIVAAVVIVVMACVIAAVTFGAAGTAISAVTPYTAAAAIVEIDKLLGALVIWEAEITKKNLMTPEIRTAIQRSRLILANVKSVVVARDVFFHLSQDKAHATRLLDAVRAKNRVAIEELLRRDAPGSSVVVQDAKEENGLFLNVRVANLTHCFSTSGQCSGKPLSFSL